MRYINNILAICSYSILRLSFRLISRNYPKNKNNILFVNLGLLGDVIMSTILFVNENIINYEYDLTIITNEKYKELFSAYNGKINIVYINKEKYRKSFYYRLEMLNYLSKKNFDKVFNLSFGRLAIDDEISLVAGLNGETLAFAHNENLKRIFLSVFDNSYNMILTRNNSSDIKNFARLIPMISKEQNKIVFKTSIFSNNNALNENFNMRKNSYFVVAPFASQAIKNWPIKNYLEIIEKLNSELNLICVLVAENKYLKINSSKRIVNLMGKTSLADVITIINKSKFFIGNDSGLLHLAIAMEIPAFGIVGGGAFGRIYPYSEYDKTAYFYSKRDCFNCDWICKYDKPYCLEDIDKNLILENIVYLEKNNS